MSKLTHSIKMTSIAAVVASCFSVSAVELSQESHCEDKRIVSFLLKNIVPGESTIVEELEELDENNCVNMCDAIPSGETVGNGNGSSVRNTCRTADSL